MILKEKLFKSKQQICDWIMNMSVKDYYEFMSILTEGKSIIEDIDNIPLEAFYTCTNVKTNMLRTVKQEMQFLHVTSFSVNIMGLRGKKVRLIDINVNQGQNRIKI